MLWKRIVSAIIGIPVLIAIVYQGGWWMTIAVAILALIGYREFQVMARRMDYRPPLWIAYPLVIALVLVAHYGGQGLTWLIALATLAVLAHFTITFPEGQPQDGAIAVVGALLTGWLLGHLILLRQLPNGLEILLLTFFITWATDTGAYFAGRAFGKRPLAKQLSPNKTIEGSIGGILLATVIGVTFGSLWFPNVNLSLLVALSILLSILGQFGDLAESALKRMAHVKDSGTLIPGHGGVLDRFDSILWTAPAAYYFFLTIEVWLR
ncbi:phosphatidate cytidylyltransferase [Heliorestis convoluta]|uniref:Phosphatidate cytidylyltransferase n=1 Tax=Heliorestis convoluta TaxID=356322 RepID=A0A5Q2N3N2_9FIRM|nr:phosphatidate cytidylyltransferase [Heliorestis convoluta]QGG48206.1 phosphatidate cytidylyltransferase [Heliorestis convoluta]